MSTPTERTHLPVKPQGIPAELRNIPQWVCWRYEERNGKLTKVPIDPLRGTYASVDDPFSWSDFDTALAACDRWGCNGVGIVLTPDLGIVGWDFDCCRPPDGTWDEAVLQMVRQLNSYTEVTPSGRGLRVFCRGSIPRSRRKGNIEVYKDGRFLTVTGQQLQGTPDTIEHRQAEVDVLYALVFAEKQEPPPPPQPESAPVSDAELLERAMKAKDGAKFRQLWSGDDAGYPSTSEADLALMSMLLFWCGGDQARAERLFSMSPRGQRSKWRERPDYRERTLRAALENKTEFYHSKNGRKPQEPERLAPPVDWTGFLRPLRDVEARPVDWLLPNLLARGEITILAGEAGAGKTTLALEIAHALTSTDVTMGERPQAQARVVWLHFDHSEGRIREKYEATYGEEPAEAFMTPNMEKLEGAGMLRLTPENVPLWASMLKAFGAECVIVDTMNDWLGCDDTDKEAKVRPLMNALRQLVEQTGVALLAIHHPNKASTLRRVTALANSYVFGAKADTVALLADPDDEPSATEVVLRVVKCRSGERWQATYRKEFGRFLPVKGAERPPTLPEKIVQHIREHGQVARKELLAVFAADASRATIDRTLNTLVRRGRLNVTTGGYQNSERIYSIPLVIVKTQVTQTDEKPEKPEKPEETEKPEKPEPVHEHRQVTQVTQVTHDFEKPDLTPVRDGFAAWCAVCQKATLHRLTRAGTLECDDCKTAVEPSFGG